jgi:serine/threonine protein phosphatase PrpC
MSLDSSQQILFNWFMRRTTNGAVRRVAELPIAIATDTGLVRTENQDRTAVLRFQLTENCSSIVAILCDGMGGMDSGSECASLAVTSFLLSCVQNNNLPLKERILIAVKNANNTVFKKYHGNGGATLSAFIADGKEGVLAVNVGDSRIYSIEKDRLSQLTTDDTISGQLAYEDKDSYGRNELLQYVGMGQGIEPHVMTLSNNALLPNILLTSDGAHFLNAQIMGSIINHATDYALAIKRLIELAKWCGGHDNASGIVVTNLSSLLTPRSNFDSRVIEIWDAFGEIQLINLGNPYMPISEHENRPAIKKTIDKNTNPTIKRSRKTTSPKKIVISLNKSKPKTITKKKIEKDTLTPELQINFGLSKE